MKKNIFISISLILFITNIKIVMSSVKYASILFFEKVFISTFPFMILSDILFYFDYDVFLSNSFIGKVFSKIFGVDNNSSSVLIFSIFTSQPNNSIYIKNLLDNCINIWYNYFIKGFVIMEVNISIWEYFYVDITNTIIYS